MHESEDSFKRERQRTQFIFNCAAFIYPLIEKNLLPQYRETLAALNLPAHLTVIDWATGTGILAAAFSERGHRVKGIDFSERLIKRARKKFPGISFELKDLFSLDLNEEPSCDIVCMGYLLHGLSPGLRQIILKKAARMANHYVLIFDHGLAGNWLVDWIERLEGSYYKEFISSDKKSAFARAGLIISKDFSTSDYGHVWLCEKLSLKETE